VGSLEERGRVWHQVRFHDLPVGHVVLTIGVFLRQVLLVRLMYPREGEVDNLGCEQCIADRRCK
jgi:hypothetical protein